MDLQEAIRALKQQKERVEQAIAALEQYLGRGQNALLLSNQRGRKSMPAEERLQVSERMKKYWAKRRQKPSES